MAPNNYEEQDGFDMPEEMMDGMDEEEQPQRAPQRAPPRAPPQRPQPQARPAPVQARPAPAPQPQPMPQAPVEQQQPSTMRFIPFDRPKLVGVFDVKANREVLADADTMSVIIAQNAYIMNQLDRIQALLSGE